MCSHPDNRTTVTQTLTWGPKLSRISRVLQVTKTGKQFDFAGRLHPNRFELEAGQVVPLTVGVARRPAAVGLNPAVVFPIRIRIVVAAVSEVRGPF